MSQPVSGEVDLSGGCGYTGETRPAGPGSETGAAVAEEEKIHRYRDNFHLRTISTRFPHVSSKFSATFSLIPVALGAFDLFAERTQVHDRLWG